MSLFDFVMNNADMLEKLYSSSGDIEVDVEPDDFDFGHNDVEVESEGTDLIFSVNISSIKLRTNINIDNLADAARHIQKIGNISTRETVIEMIEENYRQDAENAVDGAKDRLDEAQKEYDSAKKDFDVVVDTLGDLKKAWNIP